MELTLNTLRYIRMVLWSFFGIRRRAGADDELSKVRPVPLAITAVLLAAAFGALLLWVASAAVAGLS